MKNYKRTYDRDNAYNYFLDFAVPSRKHQPDHSLAKWYWLGSRFAAFLARRCYALRLFVIGFRRYFED